MKIMKVSQRGVTLLEMLVSLLILSIGLLGIAALQTRGQQFNFASYVRTQATVLGNEIIEQIQTNATFARNDVIDDIDNGTDVGKGYVIDSEGNIPTITTIDIPTTITIDYCDLNACEPADLRSYDLKRWYYYLATALPGGSGKIEAVRIPEPPDGNNSDQVRYTISITWNLREQERDDPNVGTKTISWVVQI